MTRAVATFEIRSWDEKPLLEADGQKLTRASVKKSFQGDIEGESVLEYVMFYRADGTASYTGIERITGRLGGKSGSFALLHGGTFAGGVATSRWTMVEGSGTGGLKGLRGDGGFSSGHAQWYEMTLDYELTPK